MVNYSLFRYILGFIVMKHYFEELGILVDGQPMLFKNSLAREVIKKMITLICDSLSLIAS